MASIAPPAAGAASNPKQTYASPGTGTSGANASASAVPAAAPPPGHSGGRPQAPAPATSTSPSPNAPRMAVVYLEQVAVSVPDDAAHDRAEQATREPPEDGA